MKSRSFYESYQPTNRLRFLTAASLFDGHDASINIMRRLLLSRGAEVIHLGHNRSAGEIVQAALQEDVQGIALSSYQGGHVEYFRYIRDLLVENGASDMKIFGGGGGVITTEEIEGLIEHGISRIYTPADGQNLGLQGIIGHMLETADFRWSSPAGDGVSADARLGRLLTLREQGGEATEQSGQAREVPVVGLTGTGGAGKSSLTDELLLRFLLDMEDIRIGVLCIDPSKKRGGGALLGDRIRMNAASDPRLFLRSLATRESGREISDFTAEAITMLKKEGFDLILVESSGIGQGDSAILDVCDVSLYVMTPEYGASTQLEKIDMLDFADFVVVNKFERRQGPDAVRDVCARVRRERFQGRAVSREEMPVYGTIASRFGDTGVNGLFAALCRKLNDKAGSSRFLPSSSRQTAMESAERGPLIPEGRSHYLSGIAAAIRDYHRDADRQVNLMRRIEALEEAAEEFRRHDLSGEAESAGQLVARANGELSEASRQALATWEQIRPAYHREEYTYQVRGREIRVQTQTKSLAHLAIPRVALPGYVSKADTLRFLLRENLPGYFPYTAGIFPFRRQAEDPKRQFAGEGGPLRTNTRFHVLSANDTAKRLSTAFDSVTLYGADPDRRPDIYGKVGESGVSVATLRDMQDLFSGFDLVDPMTSVSMTINGPAPIILAMYLNAAIDQQVEKFRSEHGRRPDREEQEEISAATLRQVRGTVQADILKEDQAQNTCIFSTEFALKMMADMQEYFIRHGVRNYYSVSVSGYHIAEAGANPITQLALTLANGFTFVEYYLARGMDVEEFVRSFSFFFSNGLDPEYVVLGRVARRIWAVAMRDYYKAGPAAAKFKYHIQTSGRSLHAQEMTFNDIRTTLQALMALYDNCNSLHTNAYDEAVTTPTEESVRRAMAIQMIINKELGSNRCENINQGSFFVEELTDLVEEAVLCEFEALSARGGVLGAMETQYQRSKIQEESLHYESMKDSGELPVIGVNTWTLAEENEAPAARGELIRASYAEKDDQIRRLEEFKEEHAGSRQAALQDLLDTVNKRGNTFAALMRCVRHASLGEITRALYQVGGAFRRSM